MSWIVPCFWSSKKTAAASSVWTWRRSLRGEPATTAESPARRTIASTAATSIASPTSRASEQYRFVTVARAAGTSRGRGRSAASAARMSLMLPLRMKATTPWRKSKKPRAPASTTPARARTASFLGVSASDLSATGSE